MLLTAMHLGKMNLRFLLFAVTTVILFQDQPVVQFNLIWWCVWYYILPSLLLCPSEYVYLHNTPPLSYVGEVMEI